LAKEFNSQTSDISKVLYLIELISQLKIYGNVNDSIQKIISSLKFSFNFDYAPNNVKADLYLKDSLIYDDRSNRPLQVAKKDTFIEVKYKPYTDPSYLSEFFKVDASEINNKLIMEGLSKIRNISDLKTSFIVFMSNLSENLKKTMESLEGDKIIEHLTNDLSGMIFKDNIFIPKKNIKFYWNSIGYAKRNRLSIWYEVINPEIYKISSMVGGKDKNGNNLLTFSRFVFKP